MTNPKNNGEALERFRPTMPPDVMAAWAADAQAELDALRQAAYGALKCRDTYGWSPEADEALELLREALSPTGAPMTAQAEIHELRRWKSTNAPRLEALQGLLRHAQNEAHEGREAVASLASERAANALLTNELEALRAELARKSAPGWLPIESAPEDMTEPVVVGWVNSEGEPQRCFDYKEEGCWMEWHNHVEHTHMIGGWGVSDEPPYRYWMPLPAAPDDTATGG